jgi:hypothetical protein
MVNVFRLLTVALCTAGGKCRFPIVGTTTTVEIELVAVAVISGRSGPVFVRDAL